MQKFTLSRLEAGAGRHFFSAKLVFLQNGSVHNSLRLGRLPCRQNKRCKMNFPVKSVLEETIYSIWSC